jgi:FMN reductase
MVLPMATGGSIAHMLAVDYALKPVLSALKAQEMLQGIFADDSQIAYGEGSAQRNWRRRWSSVCTTRWKPSSAMARRPNRWSPGVE